MFAKIFMAPTVLLAMALVPASAEAQVHLPPTLERELVQTWPGPRAVEPRVVVPGQLADPADPYIHQILGTVISVNPLGNVLRVDSGGLEFHVRTGRLAATAHPIPLNVRDFRPGDRVLVAGEFVRLAPQRSLIRGMEASSLMLLTGDPDVGLAAVARFDEPRGIRADAAPRIAAGDDY